MKLLLNDNRTELLRKIRDEVIDLKSSPLFAERIKSGVYPVIGEGNHYAEIMFIGEAPGKNEAETGRPFVGRAGQFLNELLAANGIDRPSVYITNIVKDRPPMNRDPLPEEIEIYAPFLDRQIEIIQPKVIATLGRFSMQYIMKRFKLDQLLGSITQLHGKVFNAKTSYGTVKIIPLYHPAVAIYNQNSKKDLHEDFKILNQWKTL